MTQLQTEQIDPVAAYEDLTEHQELDNQPIAVGLDRFVKTVGSVVMWANVLLVLRNKKEQGYFVLQRGWLFDHFRVSKV